MGGTWETYFDQAPTIWSPNRSTLVGASPWSSVYQSICEFIMFRLYFINKVGDNLALQPSTISYSSRYQIKIKSLGEEYHFLVRKEPYDSKKEQEESENIRMHIKFRKRE